MDAALRAKIMKSALGGTQETKSVSKPMGETKVEGVQDKIFEFRKQLKAIHAFEKKIKVDSEDWGDYEWKQFESSQVSAITPTNMMSLIDEVLESKSKREDEELNERRAIRQAIVNGNYTSKLGLFHK